MSLEQEPTSPEQSQERKESIFDQEKFKSLCLKWKEEASRARNSMRASHAKGAEEHGEKAEEAYNQLLEIAETALRESSGDQKILNEITSEILRIKSYGGGSETIDLADFLEDLVLRIIPKKANN